MTARLTADMKRVITEQRLAYVATVCPDGTPNLSPKGTIAKRLGDVILDGQCFQEVMRFYRDRWVDAAQSTVEARIRAFVLVKVETALPLISPAYDDSASDEPSIRKHWASHFATLNKQ